jgi:hypothetical protein
VGEITHQIIQYHKQLPTQSISALCYTDFVNKLTLTLLLSPLIAASLSGFSFAVKPRPSTVAGNDVSYPQCSKPLPIGQAFGVVGVNDGVANSTNPCLSMQLQWAQKSFGSSTQPTAQLYVNTGNPADVLAQYNIQDWPTSSVAADPYGSCQGHYTDDTACSWQYGYERAQADAQSRSIPTPASYKWWLDVETLNSWTSNPAKNTAMLEGMTFYFQNVLAAKVGLYSTGLQWGDITAGAIMLGSNLNGLDSWLAGATTQAMATSYCNLAPLTLGGHVTLTQYATSRFDYDVSCP